MRLKISEGAAGSFARIAITARVVFGVLIDMPELLNSGWLTIPIGGLLALPLLFALSQLRARRSEVPPLFLHGIQLAFFIIAAADAAFVAAGIADSASYLALNSTASVYLMIPLFALCFFCLRLNADAIADGASIWGKVLPWLLIVVVILQIDKYETGWLAPVLGPGVPALITGSVRVAGWLALPSALYLVSDANDSEPTTLHPVKTLAFNIAFATFIAVVSSMMTPAIQSEKLFTRAFRLDILLANGRSGLSLQFPAIALWYVSLFYALLFDLSAAAILLQNLLPCRSGQSCLWTTLILTALIAYSRFSTRNTALCAADWLFAAQGLLIAFGMTAAFFHGRNKHA